MFKAVGITPRDESGCDVVYSNIVGLANLNQIVGGHLGINSIILDKSVTTNVLITAANGGEITIASGIDLGNANADLRIEAPLALNQSQVWNISLGHSLGIHGRLSIQGSGLTICGHGETIIANTISGAGGLRIRSSGSTVLESRNAFSGGTELSGGGFLLVEHAGALGAGALKIPNNSTLDLAPGITLTNAAVVQGDGAESGGERFGVFAIRNPGTGAYNGQVSLKGDIGLRASVSGSVLSIGGSMNGDANVTIMPGEGSTVFQTNQLYNGKTILQGRLMLTGGTDRLPRISEVVFANSRSAELDLNDNDQTVASIQGGGVRGGNINLGRATLTVAPATASQFAGSISGAGALEKMGLGRLILAGLNNYTGKTYVHAGTVEVNGALGTTEVTVDGGTLTGCGSINGPVTIDSGGVLSLALVASPLAYKTNWCSDLGAQPGLI